jgi:PKD repeat protein
MTYPSHARRATVSMLTLLAMVMSLALLAVALPAPAQAAVSTIQERGGDVVTADALPTAQINGVAWDQEVVGNTVYVGGNFSQARPAGAAAGTNQSPRSHLMAYTLSTGVMTSWNPGANGQVRAVTSSPDGSRLYVGGDFTQVSGQSRSRIAAFNTATGQLISSFAPPVGYQVNDIVATNTTVYIGGSFAGVGSQPRQNLAAFDAASGALLGWAPTADRPVLAIELSQDGSTVLAGGHFENINGSPVRGLAKIDAVSGALLPWPVAISNAGPDSAVNSLKVEGDVVFGSGFHFGPGGNQEGPWQLKVSTGELIWVADCHGDTYDVHPSSVVYAVGHAHYCGNTSMGFPQYATWRYQHNMAWTREATGTNIREVHGYANWDGKPSPSIVNWLPTMAIGSFTGQYQAGWTIEGSGDYVVVGGEFPRVNNGAQQGLVRFATRPVAPGNRGPTFTNGTFIPDLQVVAPGAVKVAWLSAFDQDDHQLTYQVVRTGAGVVHETTATATWWDTPGLAWVDRGLTPGQTYTYSLRVRDPGGNQVFGSSRSITVPTSFTRHDYGRAVLESGPTIYWPLNDAAGTVVADHAGGYPGVAGSAVTFGVSGAVAGDTAVSVNNNNNGRIYAGPQSHAPTEMTAEVWFRTGTGSGRLLGFGDLATGNSGHRDRQIYLNNNGRVNFGVRAGGAKVITSARSYNDNQWHQAVATLSGTSARLYVDGVMVAQRHDMVEPEEYVGHWRLGGDNQSGWPSAGNANFTGAMDQVSIYDRALTPQEVNAHYVASGRTSQIPEAPADEYGKAVFELEPDLYWRLNETSGSVARDSSILNNAGTYQGTHTKNQPGALVEVDDTAVRFDGSSGYVVSDNTFTNPQQFSTEAWFRTTTTRGGKIIGFGNQRTSLSSNYDRHTFMLNDGTLTFGVWTGQENRATTTQSYNDGQWHHVVSTLGPQGMKLYVDGALVATNPNSGAENFTGYWRAGGDRVWSGATSNFFDGILDEVAVYSTPLTDAQVAQHYVTGSQDVPNVAPEAAFTFSSNGLDVSFDGSGSSDQDGSVVAWSWNFGDGTAGSGQTATRTYAAAGTYPVSLTVTDNDGAQHTVTRSVSVTEIVDNQPPTASFEVAVEGLTLTVDGTGSSDADGSIASWVWDFGDGEAGSGQTATRTYVAAGTYVVTLTVTDDEGAEDSVTREVVVTAPGEPGVLAADSFTRSVASGWGTADTGGAWTPVGSSVPFSVADGVGQIRMAAPGSGPRTYLGDVSAADVDVTFQVSLDKAPTGGDTYVTTAVRRVGSSEYRLKLRLQPTATSLILTRVVSGTETTLGSGAAAGLVYQPGDVLRVRYEVAGTSLRGKVWRDGAAEPGTWQVAATDTTPALQAPGSVGFQAYLSGSASNAPVVARFEDLSVLAVQ